MAAVNPTRPLASGKSGTEFAGEQKLLVLRGTLTSASDTITLTAAADGISTIHSAFAVIRSGQGANFQTVHTTFSGLVITLASLNGAGGAATTFGDVDVFVVGS